MNDLKRSPRLPEFKTANTNLYCDRFHETVRFYRDAIGFPVILSKSWFVEFAINPFARLSVADRTRTTMESSGGKGLTLTFQVDSLPTVHLGLSSQGCSPTAIVDHPWGARLFHVRDPEGHRLEFWSPPGKTT